LQQPLSKPRFFLFGTFPITGFARQNTRHEWWITAGEFFSYSIFVKQTSGLFEVCVRFSVETESYFTSVERICEYIKICNPEEPSDKTIMRPPSKDWPEHGGIWCNYFFLEYPRFTLICIQHHQSCKQLK